MIDVHDLWLPVVLGLEDCKELPTNVLITTFADMAEKFMCPTCSASGSDAVASCDKNIRLEECDSDENPRCMIEKYEFKNGNVRVNRMCTNKKRYEELIARCEIYRSCPLRGFCTESGCKATFEGMRHLKQDMFLHT